MNERLRLTGVGKPAPAPVIPAEALRVRGRIAAALLAQHAIAPEDAIDFTPDPRDAAAFDKLRAAGIVRQVNGRVWFDLIAYHLRREALGRVYAMWGFGVSMTIVCIALMFYWI
ncbi:MAG: hypothetical protein V4459_10225 [Pseudomonadota bacterium]